MILQIKKSAITIGIRTVAIILLIFSYSCESEKRPEEIEGDIPDVVSFSEHVVPIFNQSCNTSSCHGGTKPPDLTPESAFIELTSGGFINTDNPSSSKLYIKIDDGGSMSKYTNITDRAIILKWIEQGALEN